MEFFTGLDPLLQDADATRAGHQVDVRVGLTIIKVRVKAADNTTLDYEVAGERDFSLFHGWTPIREFNMLTGTAHLGMRSDGTTLWIAEDYAPTENVTLTDPLLQGVYNRQGRYLEGTQEDWGVCCGRLLARRGLVGWRGFLDSAKKGGVR